MEQLKVKVLVTGATGMLGSRLVLDLVQSGFDVRAAFRNKNRIDQFRKNVEYYDVDSNILVNRVEWVEADLLDYIQMSNALEGVEIVYHCAAMVSFHPSQRALLFETNINGTSNLVNICLEKGIKRICHVSSIAALGKSDIGELIDEDTAWIPEKKHSGYSISKFHSEMEIWRGVNEGLEAVIVNPSVIIGPGDWNSGSPAFYKQINNGLKFYSRGCSGFVDVRDVAKAMLLLTNESNIGKAVNKRFVLNSANMSHELLFKKIAASICAELPKYAASKLMLEIGWRMGSFIGFITGKEPLITKETAQSAANESSYDGSKITRIFGFRYRDIDETIADVGAMFLKTKKGVPSF